MLHLHCHSYYSVLDGLGSVEDMVSHVKRLGHNAIGITDHASISCMPDLFRACRENRIKPVVGCEFYITEQEESIKGEKRYHLTVWAKDWKGVQSIMKMLTQANRQFYYRPRITFSQALEFENCFIGTACAFGVLSHDNYEDIYKNMYIKYKTDLFLEIMPHKVISDENSRTDLQKIVNTRAEELKNKVGGRYLLTNDAHYIKKEDAETHRLLLCTQYGKTSEEFKGWGDQFYLKNRKEMITASVQAGLSPETIKEAIESTHYIAEKVNIEKPEIRVNLPSIYPDDNEAFLRIVLDGWNKKIEGTIDSIVPYHDRLIHEIKIIRKMNFQKYFLIVHDIITWARTRNIMAGPGRGSSAGSLVCYLMDIVEIDPLKFGLYFERFLNPDRIEMPDIDVDFQDDRRGEVFRYIQNRYGDTKTAFINTFGRVTIKSAFRDVARAFKIPPLKINSISRQIENTESFNSISELSDFKQKHPVIVDQAEKLNGTIRQVGCHPCGYVISSHPLEEVCVLERRKRPDSGEVFVTNWDKRESENFGLLKVDILGLTTLSILAHAQTLIYRRTKKNMEYTQIKLDNKKTIELFQKGETTGVFQFESSGMKNLLKNIKPKTFREITDCTALYRPGSLQSGQTKQYTDISKNNSTQEHYSTELLRPILQDTKGQLVYQEQIMQIFNRLGNFTWAESDKMRKIIGKKLGREEFDKHRDQFVKGCLENAISEDISTKLFNDMAEFASYSFNLSHAVSYTHISFWAAYLKVHHTTEFFASSLSYADDNGTESLIRDAEKFNIKVDTPDINVSGKYYQIDENGNIKYPLTAVKGVGIKAVDAIISARKKGKFKNIEDFKNRINRRACNKRVTEKLICAGAFESLGIKEPDRDERIKNFTELIAGYCEIPEISLNNQNIQHTALIELIDKCKKCASEKGRSVDFIMPHLKKPFKPNIMIINNITKGQKHLFSGNTGRYLSESLKKNGISEKDVYLTSAVKCRSDLKDCINKSFNILKQEILLLKPALIVCFSGQAASIFIKDGKMSKLHGQIKYIPEFKAFVLFSYSPQYAFFQPDKAEDLFNAAIEKLGSIISR